MASIIRHARFIIEGMIAWTAYAFLKILPIDMASVLGASIMKVVGPHLKACKTARKNIARCFPDKSESEINSIIKGMWDNLGRTIAESASIIHMSSRRFNKRVKVFKEFDNFDKSGIYVSGHLGNFELAAKISIEQKKNLNLVYRPANNKYVNMLIRHLREYGGNKLIPKGRIGLFQILKVLDNGGNIGMLVDQRMNDGVDTKFFGIPAKTTSLPAKLAIKYNIPIYIGYMKRAKGCNFTIHFKEIRPNKGDDAIEITQRINDILEQWIRDCPEQWFWVHKRWG
ncbi:MAG: lysophospholipid acyltransferase family protein [Candidatus Jidaibacter sp.]|jgi:KDO2-lipid IV(A) lauroyltransferase|nr:lysophospholipid acyltransferase family protein [Candidatus Jidaibacter sp.]